MQLTNIQISSISFNNEPFVRSLTATIMNPAETGVVPATGSGLISWDYTPRNSVYAVTPLGDTYVPSTQSPVSAIGTLIFYFSATEYNYKTTTFALCTLNIRCTRYTEEDLYTASYNQTYDTFPKLDLTLFVNYQNTNTDTLFYRTTSINPLTATVKLQSSNYTFLSAITSSNHSAWFTLNNTTKNFLVSSAYNFIRTTPCLSSVQAVLSAKLAPGSLSAWYSPHVIEKQLQVYFVPEFPTATFVAYPSTYFLDPYTYTTLDNANFITNSPGLCFYGEGHTEKIILSAQNTGNYNYAWKINNTTNEYNISADSINTAVATITSKVDFYPVLPISLQIFDLSSTYLSAESPIFYYDDTTGEKLYYPFYTSTLDLSGNESSNNTRLKQSIRVRSYDSVISTILIPGITPIVYLPLNGSKQQFTSEAQLFINNPNALSACFDRYNTIWKWSTFSECSAVSATVTPAPSTWATVECSAVFPKKWAREGVDSPGEVTPVLCTFDSISGTSWYLSAFTPLKEWDDTPVANIGKFFDFSLQLSGTGGDPDTTTPGFTVSQFSNTNVTLVAEHTVFCQITAAGDWALKETKVRDIYNFTTIEPYDLQIYTPNRYVLLNEPIFIENLFERVANAVSAVEVVLDDVAGETIYLSGNDVQQSFTISYSSVGDKTIKITGYSPFYRETFTVTYPNILRVVEEYDTVDPDSYYSISNILIDLPWKTQPTIGTNDWVVSDNINACIKIFDDNLNYLDKRSSVYSNTFNDYYGWLGSEPTSVQGVTACPIWTWQDVDCTISDNQYTITWQDVMLGGQRPEITQTGGFAQCGTWEIQTCPLTSVVPTCLGKYCLEWRWASRKSFNSAALVTWRDTKNTGSYRKIWKAKLEDCDTVKNANCDEGVWNVNIRGLNTFYDPIPVCFSQNKCSYKSIASHKNIIYAAYNTEVKLLSSNRGANFFDLRTTFNEATPFVNIKSIALDSEQKIFILDSVLSQIVIYKYDQTVPGERWSVFTTFGGVGGSLSKTKFFNPTNIHIDQYDNLWVVDSGNFVIKQFTNTGSWLLTLRDDDYFKTDPPIDVCVDSTNNVHVLTEKLVRVYTYRGEFLFQYPSGDNVIPLTGLRKITASYNREMIYIANKSQVIRHFRNGIYSGTIIDSKQCVDNINDLVHDEYRNLLVANDDKILKFVDTMTLVPLKSPLPSQYWSLKDLLIHDDEYVQNWVYTKSLHRLWDNIEIFRNTLLYNSTGSCKTYKPPIYGKDKITIGQNEIVTSAVINRVLGYLWENFNTLLEYYDPNC